MDVDISTEHANRRPCAIVSRFADEPTDAISTNLVSRRTLVPAVAARHQPSLGRSRPKFSNPALGRSFVSGNLGRGNGIYIIDAEITPLPFWR